MYAVTSYEISEAFDIESKPLFLFVLIRFHSVV